MNVPYFSTDHTEFNIIIIPIFFSTNSCRNNQTKSKCIDALTDFYGNILNELQEKNMESSDDDCI